MACENDSGWPGAGVKAGDCVSWSDLVSLRTAYNEVRDECAKYGINLTLGSGRPKYGDAPYKEEIEPLATIGGFISIKLTPGENPAFSETRFIITGGTINDRIPAPNDNYTYNHGDFGPWIVYIKSDCYGCGGWKLEEGGDHYPRYRCCSGNSCADMDPNDWKSQNYPGRGVSPDICNLGRKWGSQYMDVINSCIKNATPKTMCICDTNPSCDSSGEECCNINQQWHYSNDFDMLGPAGGAYGDPSCSASAQLCPQNHEKRGIKWIRGHDQGGYVTQVITANHINDMWNAIEPAFGGGNRTGADWKYCDGDADVWKKDNNIDLDRFRYRDCNRCCYPKREQFICACQVNDLKYVLGKMMSNTCTCDAKTAAAAWKGKTMWKIAVGPTPSVEDCPCFEQCCVKSGSGDPTSGSKYLDTRSSSGCDERVTKPCSNLEGSGSCAGATQTDDIETAEEFPDCWKQFKPRASVSGVVDNWGSVGSLQSSNQGTNLCAVGYFNGYTPVETVAGSDGKFKMKVTATSTNAQHGGPHGVQISVNFGFEDPIPSCGDFTSLDALTDCPNDPGSCSGGGGPPDYTGMNFFPIGPGNAMAFV